MVVRATLLAIAALAARVDAQQTWKVNCSGDYGAHFTDLPAAVAAAAPGDSIQIYGVFGGPCGVNYTAVTIDKPLHIVGFQVGQQPGTNNLDAGCLQSHCAKSLRNWVAPRR
jgi:hypothetical protein